MRIGGISAYTRTAQNRRLGRPSTPKSKPSKDGTTKIENVKGNDEKT